MGATPDSATRLLTISSDQYANLQTLSFNIGGTSYDLTPNAQIWPCSLNSAIGGGSTSIYLIVNDIGSPSGSGFDFCNGYTFLYVMQFVVKEFPSLCPLHSQCFYSVFDTTN
ncbi:hypothetical protein J3R83DRAFT_2769 [Lanmaoa asiatica]|nr:hypothetical protein J3R83DRAFT_2769 [Lanmaoa asiatica]